MRASLAAAALGAALLASLSPATAQNATPAGSDSLRVCVLVGDSLRELPATIDPATGDTLVGGKRFPAAFGKGRGYAESAPWYSARSWLVIGKRRHEKILQPRLIAPGLLAPAGRQKGVPLFVAAGDDVAGPRFYYVPVRPGCVFQAYEVPIY
jgi:hypothetical protein